MSDSKRARRVSIVKYFFIGLRLRKVERIAMVNF